MVEFSDILDRGFGVLEKWLAGRKAVRQAEIEAEDELLAARLRRETEAERIAAERERARIQAALERERIRQAAVDAARDDDRDDERLRLTAQDEQRDDNRDLEDLRREDERLRYDLETLRLRGEAEDERDLIDTRAGVYSDAFEIRRGDTLISRLLWPLAAVVAIGGGVYLAGRAIR